MDARTLKGLGATLVFVWGMLAGGCKQAESRVEIPVGETVEELRLVSGDSVAETGSEEPSVGKAVKSLVDDMWSLPQVVIDDTVDMVSSNDNLLWLLLAGGGGIALRNTGADRDIADNFEDHAWISEHKDWDKFVDYAGGPTVHFSATGVWYVAAAAMGNEKGKQDAWTMLEALSVNGAITVFLKMVVDDDTPNDKTWAWPSGHTSSSFTVAAVLDEFYGPMVGIPAYMGAGFVGYRMMDSGDHWASDVLFGAVLGYMVGHYVAAKNRGVEVAGFDLIPYQDVVCDKPVTGLGFYKEF